MLNRQLLTLAIGLGLFHQAQALPNDIALNNLVEKEGGALKKDPETGLAIGDQAGFKGLATELGFVFSPRALGAAETPGHAGFDIGVDYSLNFIQNTNYYWTEATERGQAGEAMPGVLQTLGVQVRKGLPFSFEIGGGGRYLFESHLYAIGGDVKWALNEGFIWFPDVAVTFGINRLLGNSQLDLTVMSAGAQISKTFGIFGMLQLAPFVGYNFVMINAASSVLDADPYTTDDVTGTFAFNQLSFLENGYHRVLAGLRLGSFIFDLTLEGDFNFAGTQSVHQLGLKLSLDF